MNISKCGFASFFVSWALCATASAQVLSLDEAVARMMEYSKRTQLLELERATASDRTRAALAERLPRVQLSLGYLQTQQDIISQDNDTFQEGTSDYPTTTYTFSVIQPIYDAERFRQYPLAVAEEQLAELQLEAGLNELWSDLIQRYLAVAEAQAQMAQQNAISMARENLWRDAQTLMAAGRIESAQVIAIQSEYLATLSQSLIAEQQLAQALEGLMQLVGPGVSGVDVAAFAERLPTVDSLLQKLPRSELGSLNPSIQLADADREVAEKQLRLINGAYYPKVSLRVQTEQETTEGSLFGGGSEVASTDYGVDITWLLYEGGSVAARSEEALKKVSLAVERQQEVVQATERRFDALIGVLRRYEQVLDALSAEKALADDRVKAVRAQVDSGRVGLGAMQEAELKLNTVNIQLQQQSIAFLKAQAELYALFGALDVEQLNQALTGGALASYPL